MKSVFQDCVFGCFYLYLKEMDPRQSFIVGDIRRDICHQVELGRYWERKWLLPGPTALAFQLPTINGDQQNMRKNWWQSKERKYSIQKQAKLRNWHFGCPLQCIDYCQRNKEQKTFQILGPNLIDKLYETPKKDRKVVTFNLKYFKCINIILHLAH